MPTAFTARLSLRWCLLLIPLSVVLSVIATAVPNGALFAFLAAAGALMPLAELIGVCTEQIAVHAGPRTGGLLTATFSNVPELILAVFLLAGGQAVIVKASLTGSIVANILLVLGAALLAGGRGQRVQRYSAAAAGVHATTLTLAVIGFLMPGVFVLTTGAHDAFQLEVVSTVVAVVLITLYLAALVFTQANRDSLFRAPKMEDVAVWSLALSVVLLVLAAGATALEAGLLVRALEPALAIMGLSKFFVGFILVPIIGNVAEASSAVRFALRNKLDVTFEIAIGSSTQVALFVAPALVLISLALRHPMDLVFTAFQLTAVGLSTLILALVSHDGRSNWLEGAQLIAAYVIVATSSFFVGSP